MPIPARTISKGLSGEVGLPFWRLTSFHERLRYAEAKVARITG